MNSAAPSWSLRRRVQAIGAAAAIATLLAAGASMYYAADVEDQRLLDDRLGAMAQTILSFAKHEIEEMQAQGQSTAVDVGTDASFSDNHHYQIWSTQGHMLLRTVQAPLVPLRPLAETGFATTTLGNERFRTFSLTSDPPDGMIIQLAEPLASRHGALGRVAAVFLALMAVPLTLIFTAKWWFLNQTLLVIDSFAKQLQQRHPLDLALVMAKNPPLELKPMLDSVNGFIGRAGRALSTERGFTAMAAHEMRTPLAGIRARAQLAMSASSPEEASGALLRLIESVDHASHLQSQLLELAQVEYVVHELAQAGSVAVDLSRAYHDVLSHLGQAAAERNLTLTEHFEVSEVHATRLTLHLLLHNLLSNAIRYANEGGRVEVSCTGNNDSATLTVDDSGPGIPKEQREQAFERFNRLGRLDAQGVGLGLSIVQAVVQAHRATVQLDESPLGGLRVQVRFVRQQLRPSVSSNARRP